MTMNYDPQHFHDQLVEHGFIIPTGVQGGYGRGAMFEDILERFNALVSRTAQDDGAETFMFPPIVPRALIERVGYMDNFPHLAGSVSSFFGSDREAKALSDTVNAGERWEHLL